MRANQTFEAKPDALLLMTWAEQVEFIQALESEMRRENLSITDYGFAPKVGEADE
jgi:hypothetical protein